MDGLEGLDGLRQGFAVRPVRSNGIVSHRFTGVGTEGSSSLPRFYRIPTWPLDLTQAGPFQFRQHTHVVNTAVPSRSLKLCEDRLQP